MTKATEVMISDMKDALVGNTIIDFQYRKDNDYYILKVEGGTRQSRLHKHNTVPTTMVFRFMSDIDKDFKITDNDKWVQDKMDEIEGYLETLRGK